MGHFQLTADRQCLFDYLYLSLINELLTNYLFFFAEAVSYIYDLRSLHTTRTGVTSVEIGGGETESEVEVESESNCA